MSDWWGYVALPGLVALTVMAGGEVYTRARGSGRDLLVIGAAVILVALTVKAHMHARHFRSDLALWMHVSDSNRPRAIPIVEQRLATELIKAGRYEQALWHAEIAADMRPDHWFSRYLVCRALAGMGLEREAFQECFEPEPQADSGR